MVDSQSACIESIDHYLTDRLYESVLKPRGLDPEPMRILTPYNRDWKELRFTDLMDFDLVLDAVEKLKKAEVPNFSQGLYRTVVTPRGERQLYGDRHFRLMMAAAQCGFGLKGTSMLGMRFHTLNMPGLEGVGVKIAPVIVAGAGKDEEKQRRSTYQKRLPEDDPAAHPEAGSWILILHVAE